MMTFTDTLNATSYIPLALRGGHIVPVQQAGLTTFATHSSPFSLYVGLDYTGTAMGRIVIDDGENIDNIDRGDFWDVRQQAVLSLSNNVITGAITQFHLSMGTYDVSALHIDRVAIIGLDLPDSFTARPPILTVQGKSTPLSSATLTLMNGALIIDLDDQSPTPIPIQYPWSLTFGTGSEGNEEEHPLLSLA